MSCVYEINLDTIKSSVKDLLRKNSNQVFDKKVRLDLSSSTIASKTHIINQAGP